jgi:protein Mpv17
MANALARAFSSPASTTATVPKRSPGWTKKPLHAKTLRKEHIPQHDAFRPSTSTTRRGSSLAAFPIAGDGLMSWASSMGSLYTYYLETHPIATKSVTASLSFGLADYLAQTLTRKGSSSAEKPLDLNRIKWAMLVGLVYYGPAAHAWVEGIFQLLPSTSIGSTLLKAFLGQLSFSPGFTCVFFATTLIRNGQWSFDNWFHKIGKDLPPAWVAGIGFWVVMDIFSYSCIQKDFIPVFNTCCSFVWTIYLSLVSNRLQRG